VTQRTGPREVQMETVEVSTSATEIAVTGSAVPGCAPGPVGVARKGMHRLESCGQVFCAWYRRYDHDGRGHQDHHREGRYRSRKTESRSPPSARSDSLLNSRQDSHGLLLTSHAQQGSLPALLLPSCAPQNPLPGAIRTQSDLEGPLDSRVVGPYMVPRGVFPCLAKNGLIRLTSQPPLPLMIHPRAASPATRVRTRRARKASNLPG